MSDEQVLASAVQKAYDEAPNFWWLHSRKVALIFDQNRAYKLPPDLVENLYEKKKERPDVEFEIEAASLNPFK